MHEELENIDTPPSGCILARNLEEVVQLHQKVKRPANQYTSIVFHDKERAKSSFYYSIGSREAW
jgi:hypothetical protein